MSAEGGAIPARWPPRLAMALLLLAPIVGVAVFRLAAFGWAQVAPDDARYLNVGLAVLAGRGPLTPDGNLFLLRSPTYGVILALGADIVGGDPLVGARLVAASLMIVGFTAAVRLGWVTRGIVAGLATAVAIIATPLIWRLLPTLRIDLVQAAAALGVVLSLRRPSPARWAIAGGLFGLSILIKETGGLLGLLPLAWLGLLPPRRWLRLGAVFVGSAAVVAGWWWVFVWIHSGVLFPLNAVGVIERRDVTGALRVTRTSLPIVAAFVVSWLVVARSIRRDIDARLLVGAGLALVPPALYATVNGLSTRNYADLALFSGVAVGVAGADILGALQRGLSRVGEGSMARIAMPLAFVVLATPAMVLGQHQVGRPSQATLPEVLSAWLLERTGPGERVVMTFRLSGVVALRLGGRVPVAGLSVNRVPASDDPADYVWMGLRGRQLFGYRRDVWLATLSAPPSRFLVMVEPHVFTPVELLMVLASSSGRASGFVPAADLRAGNDEAHVFELDPGRIGTAVTPLGLHLSPEGAKAWVALAGGPAAGASARLAAARPIIVGDPARVTALLAALGPSVCLTRAGPDEPAGAAVLGTC